MKVELQLKKKIFLALYCSLFIPIAFAQKINLNLNLRVEDAHYKKLILVSPVFTLRNDSIANPLDISSAKVGDGVTWYKVNAPEMNAKFRKGYCWLFDGTSKLEIAESYTLILIENPGWTLYPSRIWVDRNHNLDLLDDGPADTLTLEKPVIVTLGHANGYQVLLEHFPSEKFRSFEVMNDQAIRKLQGDREFLGTASSLREKRMNVIAAHWNNGLDSFTIGIKDANCNGIYNEPLDVAMITTYKGVFENLQGVKLENGKAYLEWNNAAYQIEEIEKDGAYITLNRDTQSNLIYSLNVGEKIPKFKYCTTTKPSRHKSIRRLKGKCIYVYIWRDGTDAFYRDSADWHTLGRLKRIDFEVLGLNYGGSARYVFQYNRRFETQIRQGFSSNDVNDALMIKQLPTGILIDKKQRIVATGLIPSDVEKVLDDYLKGQ